MKNTKKKTIEQLSIRDSPMEEVRVYDGKDLRKMYLLSLEWKRVGVTENDSGDNDTDELMR